jgi:hypothetical protein
MSKHRKSPWPVAYERDREQTRIYAVFPAKMSLDEIFATGHIMSAAPEMYDVLELLTIAHSPDVIMDVVEHAKEILKKARGEK